jgi:hypothetical protein
MKKLLLLLTVFLVLTTLKVQGQQKDCDDCDVVHPKHTGEYKQFMKENCNEQFKKYFDSKKSKELFCKAKYDLKDKFYETAIKELFKAYQEANSPEFKFQIIKVTQQAYSLKGDTLKASEWQARIDKILNANPDIDQ